MAVATATAAPQATPVEMCMSPDYRDLTPAVQLLVSQTDCLLNSNAAGAAYDPTYVMEIPVVWHVITRTDNFGDVSDQRIINQMAHMNASFAGQLDSQGHNAGIRFVLASVDPQGQPTTGINRVANNSWFADSGNYTTLTWDSNRYLNIYTLQPFNNPGVIGYVSGFPASGLVGSADDAVRMLHSAIDSVQFPHVVSHEVGHHFGLYHTFQGQSCANSSCNDQGDLICDTNPHTFPTQVCGGTSGNCPGLPGPGNNFMNYQNVNCVWEFTPNQIQRMRCTLENWRPNLWMPSAPIGVPYCSSTANSTGGAATIAASGSTSVAENNVTLTAGPVPNSIGIFYYGTAQANAPFGNGIRCVSGQIVRLGVQVPSNQTMTHLLNVNEPQIGVPGITAGSVLFFQAWFRDVPAGGALFDLSDGVEITFTP